MSSVEELLEEGKLISPEVKEEIDSLNDDVIQTLLDSNSMVIGKDELRELSIPRPEVMKEDEEVKEEIHVSDFTEFYLERFKFLKNEIKERMDKENTSSINRVSSGKASIIGMVRQCEDDEIIVEDNTGKITVRTSEKFLEDEVIGVKGEVIKNDEVVMSPDKIFYPDVPLGKEVKSLDQDLSALFVTEITEDVMEKIEEIEPEYVFSVSEVKNPGSIPAHVVCISPEETENSSKDPLRCDLGSLRILMHDGSSVEKAQSELERGMRETLIFLLKRRHLNPIEMHSLRDRYLLKEVPDILHTKGDENVAANYKGVTLLSTTEEEGFLVNLETREVEELDFSS